MSLGTRPYFFLFQFFFYIYSSPYKLLVSHLIRQKKVLSLKSQRKVLFSIGLYCVSQPFLNLLLFLWEWKALMSRPLVWQSGWHVGIWVPVHSFYVVLLFFSSVCTYKTVSFIHLNVHCGRWDGERDRGTMIGLLVCKRLTCKKY